MPLMVNHPNRAQAGRASSPEPEAVREARQARGLSQGDAAALIYCSLRAWQDWEAGLRRMHPAMWELWRMKAPPRE